VNKIKLSFNVHSTADWLSAVGVLVIVAQFVAQIFGFKWTPTDTNQIMSAVNTIIAALVALGLLHNTTPTETDKEISDAVKESETTTKGDTTSEETTQTDSTK